MVGRCFSFGAFIADVVSKIGFTFGVNFDLGGLEGFDKERVYHGGDGLLGHEALGSVCKGSEGSCSPSHEARVLVSDLVKRGKVIRDDRFYEGILDLGASGINPFIHFNG